MSTPAFNPQHANPAPRRKRHTLRNVLLAFLAVIVVIVVISAVTNGGTEPTPSYDAASSPRPEDTDDDEDDAQMPTAGVGGTVADGDLTFKVRSVKTATKIGDQYATHRPQGKYVLVALDVTNHADSPHTFSDTDQYLIDKAGRQYSADSEAVIYLGDKASFLDNINPGNTKRGVIAFDVPKSVDAAQLQLHDSPFSDGAIVALNAKP